jgi:hypothetical protein
VTRFCGVSSTTRTLTRSMTLYRCSQLRNTDNSCSLSTGFGR